MYKKLYYTSPCGFSLHHTKGEQAGKSTLDYLHRTATYMLLWLIEGRGSVVVEGRRYEIRQGDVILLQPSELFCCTVEDGHAHERVVLHIPEEMLAKYPCDARALLAPFRQREKGMGNRISGQMAQKCGIDKSLGKLLRQMQEGVEPALTMCTVTELLEKLYTLVPAQTAEEAVRQPMVDLAVSYIREHYSQSITVEDVAAACSVHKSYLSHLFKEYMGMPVWSYVILRRISRFNELILEGWGAEQASWQVGFRNYANFYRLYKKQMGMTPAQYKKQVQK